MLRMLRSWLSQPLAGEEQKSLFDMDQVYSKSSQLTSSAEETLIIITSFVRKISDVIFVLDSLDECSLADLDEMIEIISFMSKLCPTVIFTREIRRLRDMMQDAELIRVSMDQTARDVSLIDKEEVQSLTKSSNQGINLQHLEQVLVKKSFGHHLSSRLALDNLRN